MATARRQLAAAEAGVVGLAPPAGAPATSAVAQAAPPRPAKSQAAFRTISEVADELGVAQHVLRFWESKFPQIRPLKRGGGRRYYRPEDVDLLRQVKVLLYDEGYTIKGAQKLLRTRRPRPADATAAAAATAEQPPPPPPAPPATASAPPRRAPSRVAATSAPFQAGPDLGGELRLVSAGLVDLRESLRRARDA